MNPPATGLGTSSRSLGSASRRPAQGDELLSPATQIVGSRADYLGEDPLDIGQRVGDDRLELFVTVDPATALLQRLALLTPEFIALHDIGGHASSRLLGAVASALNTRLQHLVIRRQGLGLPLATLPFVEIPGHGGHGLRVYGTDIDADTRSRRQLANVLLGHSRLGVLLVAELPPHALAHALQPVRDALQVGPWPNRQLLLVPLAASAALAAQASTLAGRSAVQVRVTPRAAHANDAWPYITGAWNRLREPATGGPAAATHPAPAVVRWPTYLHALQSVKGLRNACVFDLRTRQVLAHQGSRADADALAAQGLALHQALLATGKALGLAPAVPEAAVTLGGCHLLLHPLPGSPGLMLHAQLDASQANLALTRLQLQRADASLQDPGLGS